MTSAPQSETITFQKERYPRTGNREMDEDFSYREDTYRGQLSTSEITSSGENRYLLQSLEDARDLGMSRRGGKQLLELRITATAGNHRSGFRCPRSVLQPALSESS